MAAFPPIAMADLFFRFSTFKDNLAEGRPVPFDRRQRSVSVFQKVTTMRQRVGVNASK